MSPSRAPSDNAAIERASQWLYPILVCPACRGELEMDEEDASPMRCAGCGKTYPWLGRIPVLVEQEAVDPGVVALATAWNMAAPGWRQNLHKPARVLAATEAPLLRAAKGLVVEVGCGDGRLFPLYEARGLRVIGLDISAVMLQMAEPAGVPLVLADAHRLPFRDCSVDTVLVPFATVRYLDYGGFFGEAYRVLRSGGVLGFTAWNAVYNGVRSVARHDERAWREGRDVLRVGEILDPLRHAGLRLKTIYGVFSAPRRSPLRERVALRVRGKVAACLARDIVVLAHRP